MTNSREYNLCDEDKINNNVTFKIFREDNSIKYSFGKGLYGNVIFIIAWNLTDTQYFDIYPTLIRGIGVYIEKKKHIIK